MRLRTLSLLAAGCAVLALVGRAQFNAPTPAPREPFAGAVVPEKDRRPPENTFLTFPEWYLVYSPDEYAELIATRPPSEFPYLGHLGQFWQGYAAMYAATKDDYPFNSDYHVMVMVIGGSTTVEYGMKWLYETTVGRVAEVTRRHGMTAEDELAATVAREYVTSLDEEPWYKFDYMNALKRVWTETDYWGPDPVRKWERKYYLTSEYLAKAGYAGVLRLASESFYGEVLSDTAVVVDREPAEMPKMRVAERFGDGSALVYLPRYQPFTAAAQALAKDGCKFVEVAGNRDVVLVSAVVPTGFEDPAFRLVMTQPILTRPGTKRVVFTVPVPGLSDALRSLGRPGLKLEHVYDY